MIITGLTCGENEGVKFEVPLIPIIDFEAQQLNVIKNLLDGTNSDEWLVESETKILNNG